MTDSKKHILFDQSGQCCSLKQMQQYIAGTLSREEMLRVERHLADCTLCSDALEGLSLADKGKVGDIVSDINRRIDSRFIARKLQGTSIYSRVAAVGVIAILVSVGIYGYFNFRAGEEERIFAENFEKYPGKFKMDSVVQRLKDQNSEKPEALQNVSPPSEAVANQEKITEESISENNKNISSKDKVIRDEDADLSAPAYSYTPDKTMQPAAPMPEIVVEAESKSDIKETTTQSASGNKMSTQEISSIRSETNINVDTIMANAMQYYSQNKYPQAIALFDLVIDQVEDQNDALLYRGISYLEENELKKAVKDFNILIKSNNPEYLEVAKWYKSLALVKQKKNKEARQLLQEVVNMNGVYKEKALNVLKDLN